MSYMERIIIQTVCGIAAPILCGHREHPDLFWHTDLCPFCRSPHGHGWLEGHRWAHCANTFDGYFVVSPFDDTGIIPVTLRPEDYEIYLTALKSAVIPRRKKRKPCPINAIKALVFATDELAAKTKRKRFKIYRRQNRRFAKAMLARLETRETFNEAA